MTDTTAPQTWGQTLKTLVLGLLPSLNTSLIAVVTALVTIGGTLATQRIAAAKPEPAKAAPDLSPILAEIIEMKERMILVEGYAALSVDEVIALRQDFKTPRAAPRAVSAKPAAAVLPK